MLNLGARLAALCFAVAFLSLAVQYVGLISSTGLEPAQQTLHRRLGDNLEGGWAQQAVRYGELPTLLVFSRLFGLPLDVAIEALCLVGFLVSAWQASRKRPSPIAFAGMFLLYLSLFLVGGTFLSFQWDILLLEVGAAMVLALPVTSSASAAASAPGRFLLRFALLKLMLMAGAVKVQSRCPTWAALTATQVHFASQCIPAPAAWVAHNLPPLVNKVGVAATMWVELPATLLLLSPPDELLRIGLALQVALQVLIMATGNYNFFNVLTIALCVVAWPPSPTASQVGSGEPPQLPSSSCEDEGPIEVVRRWLHAARRSTAAVYAQRVGAVLFAAYTAWYMFDVRWLPASPNAGDDASRPWWARVDIVMHPARMSPDALEALLDRLLPPLLWACAAVLACICTYAFVAEAAAAAAHCFSGRWRAGGGALQRACNASSAAGAACLRVVWLLVTLAAVATVFCASCAMLLTLRPQLLHAPSTPGALLQAYNLVAPFHVTSGYGLFRSMTGVASGESRVDEWGQLVVGTERPEVVIEGLWLPDDLVAAGAVLSPAAQLAAAGAAGKRGAPVWLEIELPYKPGNVVRAPPFVAPHQPRLDWQMWFAALSHYSQAPWFVHLMDGIVEGTPAIFSLLDVGAFPVARNATLGPGAPTIQLLVPPVAVRAALYHYDFTRAPAPWSGGRVKPLDPAPPASASRASVPLGAAEQFVAASTRELPGTTRQWLTAVVRQHLEPAAMLAVQSLLRPLGLSSAADSGTGSAVAAAWWQRRAVGEYFPTIFPKHPSVTQALQQLSWPRPERQAADATDSQRVDDLPMVQVVAPAATVDGERAVGLQLNATQVRSAWRGCSGRRSAAHDASTGGAGASDTSVEHQVSEPAPSSPLTGGIHVPGFQPKRPRVLEIARDLRAFATGALKALDSVQQSLQCGWPADYPAAADTAARMAGAALRSLVCSSRRLRLLPDADSWFVVPRAVGSAKRGALAVDVAAHARAEPILQHVRDAPPLVFTDRSHSSPLWWLVAAISVQIAAAALCGKGQEELPSAGPPAVAAEAAAPSIVAAPSTAPARVDAERAARRAFLLQGLGSAGDVVDDGHVQQRSGGGAASAASGGVRKRRGGGGR